MSMIVPESDLGVRSVSRSSGRRVRPKPRAGAALARNSGREDVGNTWQSSRALRRAEGVFCSFKKNKF